VNAEFIALAFVAALNPKLLAVDLLLIENRRPRAMFLCVLLGGLTVGINLEAAPGGVAAKQAPLQFQLQFTRVQHRPWRFIQAGDLHGWTPVDVRKHRAADS